MTRCLACAPESKTENLGPLYQATPALTVYYDALSPSDDKQLRHSKAFRLYGAYDNFFQFISKSSEDRVPAT